MSTHPHVEEEKEYAIILYASNIIKYHNVSIEVYFSYLILSCILPNTLFSICFPKLFSPLYIFSRKKLLKPNIIPMVLKYLERVLVTIRDARKFNAFKGHRFYNIHFCKKMFFHNNFKAYLFSKIEFTKNWKCIIFCFKIFYNFLTLK